MTFLKSLLIMSSQYHCYRMYCEFTVHTANTVSLIYSIVHFSIPFMPLYISFYVFILCLSIPFKPVQRNFIPLCTCVVCGLNDNKDNLNLN